MEAEMVRMEPKKSSSSFENKFNHMLERISKYIEEISLLLDYPLKNGVNFSIDVQTKKKTKTFRSYGKLSGAVYIFYLDEHIEFDGNRFFKIGRVGPKSTARFDSQHYNPRGCKSNLAQSILDNKSKLNFKCDLNDDTIGEFIVGSFIRINILFYESAPEFANELVEALLHYKYKPFFEGLKSQRKD